MSISLMSALRVSTTTSVAFTGAGGKTTAMFQLARELKEFSPVIVSASTHLGAWQIPLAIRHLVVESSDLLNGLKNDLQGITLITGAFDGDRTKPLGEESLRWLSEFCRNNSIPLLVEADGSRQKPLKAWADHEPPIPQFANVVVEVAGLTGIGKPLNDEFVHRPEIFSSLSGLKLGDLVTSEALLRLVSHPDGGQKNIPAGARKVILLNHADTTELQAIGHGMSRYLLQSFHSVVITSLQKKTIFAGHEPVAGIVLAAGGSTRYGQPKQLLDWKGQPFVRAVANTALEAGLSPVIVVLGANAEQVEESVRDLDVVIVRNDDWRSGQASSIREGISALTPTPSPLQGDGNSVGGAIFLLVDQPQVSTSILRALVEKHAEGLHPVVLPMVMDRRANPVLFDRATFDDLLTLEGDVGGRGIFHKYRVEYLPWHDDRLLLDVDTPDQYQRLISDETL